MTNSTTYNASSNTTHEILLRVTGLSGLVGGAAWIIDTVTIAVLNRSFEPLDSILFFIGFGGLVLTVVSLSVHLSAGHTGRARARRAIIAFLATVVALGTVSFAADTVGRYVFPPTNIGLHDEWSCFTVGLCMLVISGWASLRSHRR